MEKQLSVTYCECVFVALVIQHVMRVRRIVISGLPGFKGFFSHYIISRTIFEKQTKTKTKKQKKTC